MAGSKSLPVLVPSIHSFVKPLDSIVSAMGDTLQWKAGTSFWVEPLSEGMLSLDYVNHSTKQVSRLSMALQPSNDEILKEDAPTMEEELVFPWV